MSAQKYIYKGPGVHRAILEFDGFSRREGRRRWRGGGRRSRISVRCVLVSCLRSLRRCTAPCRCWTATQELRGRGYQFMRCNIVGTRARSSSRCRREVPEDRSAGRNPVAERRVPCKIVLGVNDNSGRRIPGRLTFESKEPRLKLYAFDLNARLSCAFRSFRPPSSSSLTFRADTWAASLASLSLSFVVLHPRDREDVVRRVGSMTRSE